MNFNFYFISALFLTAYFHCVGLAIVKEQERGGMQPCQPLLALVKMNWEFFQRKWKDKVIRKILFYDLFVSRVFTNLII